MRGARSKLSLFSPGRKDARVAEARAMLSMRAHLDGLEARGLACVFNLKEATAEKLIAYERARRGNG
jgi:hypothetical protein